jgi:hypothetical protein
MFGGVHRFYLEFATLEPLVFRCRGLHPWRGFGVGFTADVAPAGRRVMVDFVADLLLP